ncbi:MAG: glycerophosphodiester phosphodiesterase [Alistipes shahii]
MKTASIAKTLLSVAFAAATVTFVQAQPKESAIVAHRGYWNCKEGGYARNSLAALESAQKAGFWGSEFDVNMTSDGELLIFHDAHIDGKRIDQTPYAEFKDYRLENGEPIPTLDQYLAQAKKYPKTVLVFEMKWHSTDEIENRAIALSIEKLKKYKLFSPKHVIFISFSPNASRVLAQSAPDSRCSIWAATAVRHRQPKWV